MGSDNMTAYTLHRGNSCNKISWWYGGMFLKSQRWVEMQNFICWKPILGSLGKIGIPSLIKMEQEHERTIKCILNIQRYVEDGLKWKLYLHAKLYAAFQYKASFIINHHIRSNVPRVSSYL